LHVGGKVGPEQRKGGKTKKDMKTKHGGEGKCGRGRRQGGDNTEEVKR